MILKISFVSILIFVLIQNRQNSEARPLDKTRVIEYCPQLGEQTLTMILGPAYNPRYMSIEKPSISSKSSNTKRDYHEDSFFVDNTYQQEISNKAAWDVNHVELIMSSQRITRSIDDRNQQESQRDVRRAFLDKISSSSSSSSSSNSRDKVFKNRPWECEAKVKWIDLGVEYFPRYIRSVDCTRKECWYGHYTCKPRSFTVKVLRRHTGECIRISQKLKVFTSINQFNNDFTELWTWEEKAVNFCCDCVTN